MSRYVTLTVDPQSDLGRAVEDPEVKGITVVIGDHEHRLTLDERNSDPQTMSFRQAFEAIGPLWSQEDADHLKSAIAQSRALDITADSKK